MVARLVSLEVPVRSAQFSRLRIHSGDPPVGHHRPVPVHRHALLRIALSMSAASCPSHLTTQPSARPYAAVAGPVKCRQPDRAQWLHLRPRLTGDDQARRMAELPDERLGCTHEDGQARLMEWSDHVTGKLSTASDLQVRATSGALKLRACVRCGVA
jgi:hypothetical protein